MPQVDHVAHLRADAADVAATISVGALAQPIPACPGWDLRALCGHLGWVHRWATAAVRDAHPPDPAVIDDPPLEPAALAAWVLDGGRTLADELERHDADAPTWHPFPAPLRTGVWRRRQAQETSLHRWDAQAALGTPEPIEPGLAADGVDEYFRVMLPRRFERDGGGPPERAGVLLVHADDVDRVWCVRSEEGAVLVSSDPEEHADAQVRGPASLLLLALWARVDPETLVIGGDGTLAAAWLALGGN